MKLFWYLEGVYRSLRWRLKLAMIVAKSILTGLATGLMVAMIWILLVVVIPFLIQTYAVTRDAPVEVADASRVVRDSVSSRSFSEWPVLGMALLGFAGGFYWELQRAAARTRTH